jgi:hypothetical protein
MSNINNIRLYYSFNKYLKERFRYKVRKISIDAGFTCPNRDGTKGIGGCIYCENKSFSPYAKLPNKTIRQQIEHGIDFQKRTFGAEKFIIYFQARTNTYAPIEKLKMFYDIALSYPDIVGLAIGTRPDCVPEPVLDLLSDYKKKVDVWLELGLQSAHNATLNAINRCHTFEDFEDAVLRAKKKRFLICTHVIFGLPGETREMMFETVRRITNLGLDAIKIHHLYIAKGTIMENMFKSGKVKVLELYEWVKLASDILERLPPNMIIQRLVGEVNGEYLVAPEWGISKSNIIKAIEDELRARNSYQGKFFSEQVRDITSQFPQPFSARKTAL